MELGEIVQEYNVRPIARGDGPPVVEPEALGGVQRGHAQGGDRVDALLHAQAQVVVYVSLLQDGLGLTVVGAEEAAAAVLRRDPLG